MMAMLVQSVAMIVVHLLLLKACVDADQSTYDSRGIVLADSEGTEETDQELPSACSGGGESSAVT